MTPSSSPDRWFDLEQVGPVTIVRFLRNNILDEKAVQTVGEQLFLLVEKGNHRKIVLNLRTVESMNSSMLPRLITFQRKLEAVRGRLAICQLHPKLYEIFSAIRLTRVLKIYAEEKDALKALEEAGV